MTFMFDHPGAEEFSEPSRRLRDLAAAATVIESTLAGATVNVGAVRLRVLREDGESLAIEIVEALEASGFQVRRC